MPFTMQGVAQDSKSSCDGNNDQCRRKKIHCLQPAFQDGLVKCGVSCDGTWQRRGFSFLNGCVTAISMDTGQILDVLSKVIVKQSHCYKMSITSAIRNP